MAGKWVLLVKDVSEVDPYDRLLRYVFVGNIFVNHELVKTGFATATAYPPDVSCQSLFKVAEDNAIKPHQPPTPIPTEKPAPTAKPAPTKDSGGENCHPSYPTVCIPPPPPDLDCGDIPYRNIKVLPPDPHNFDGNNDGMGCEG